MEMVDAKENRPFGRLIARMPAKPSGAFRYVHRASIPGRRSPGVRSLACALPATAGKSVRTTQSSGPGALNLPCRAGQDTPGWDGTQASARQEV